MGNLTTPKRVQKLQMALHAKAKAEAGYRFYALYDKISREDILAHAYAQCRSNKGAPGVSHRQTKGAETDMPGLPPPRHFPTLPPRRSTSPSAMAGSGQQYAQGHGRRWLNRAP